MDTLILNGHDLTLQDVYDVAYDGRKVEIAADAYARLAKGREIMQELSKGGKAIYGINRGVGQNKDVTIDECKTLINAKGLPEQPIENLTLDNVKAPTMRMTLQDVGKITIK